MLDHQMMSFCALRRARLRAPATCSYMKRARARYLLLIVIGAGGIAPSQRQIVAHVMRILKTPSVRSARTDTLYHFNERARARV